MEWNFNAFLPSLSSAGRCVVRNQTVVSSGSALSQTARLASQNLPWYMVVQSEIISLFFNVTLFRVVKNHGLSISSHR